MIPGINTDSGVGLEPIPTNTALGNFSGSSAIPTAQDKSAWLTWLNVPTNSDSRLSDARDWFASSVSQAEAEAGTEVIDRKWSALRVRQSTRVNPDWDPTGNLFTIGTTTNSQRLRLRRRFTGAGDFSQLSIDFSGDNCRIQTQHAGNNPNPLHLGTGGVERLFIAADAARVGIGGAPTTRPLEIFAGTAGFRLQSSAAVSPPTYTEIARTFDFLTWQDSTSPFNTFTDLVANSNQFNNHSMRVFVHTSGVSAPVLHSVFHSSGRMLIGTDVDNGTDRLQVNGGIRASGNSRIPRLGIGLGTPDLSGLHLHIIDAAADIIGFYVQNTADVSSTGSPRIAIGHGGPTAFSIAAWQNRSFIEGQGSNGLVIGAEGTPGSPVRIYSNRTTWNTGITLTSGNRVLIGTATDDGANRLQVTGNIATSGSLTFASGNGIIESGSSAMTFGSFRINAARRINATVDLGGNTGDSGTLFYGFATTAGANGTVFGGRVNNNSGRIFSGMNAANTEVFSVLGTGSVTASGTATASRLITSGFGSSTTPAIVIGVASHGIWADGGVTQFTANSGSPPFGIRNANGVYGAILASNASLSFATSTDLTGTTDVTLFRSATAQLDLLANNGLRVRNATNTANAPFSAGAITASGHITSAFQTLAADPSTIDIAAGMHRVVKNTTSGEVRDWVNDGGIMRRSPAYT